MVKVTKEYGTFIGDQQIKTSSTGDISQQYTYTQGSYE